MSDIASLLLNQAPILHRSANEICFQVDHVEPCQERLASTKARSKLEEKTGRSLLACSHDDSCTVVGIREVGEHAFVNAVHLAFSEHRPWRRGVGSSRGFYRSDARFDEWQAPA